MTAQTDVAGSSWRLDGAFLLVAPAVVFLVLCVLVVRWIFRTGYNIKP